MSQNQHHQAKPTDYGWTPQGSNSQSRVEYYQKGDTKMDYYPTTGTVKTSMDHPSQGKTQMFRRDLNEGQFQSVLQNPREHTGQGYQRK
eukprot:CAMPEP_0184652934 /NCGR_PEP_ID=MMETSP0308-20130426/10646_1 /TAXON_ID=38269 /ORGANISM="Gloeochaete witrockiana, Strain SAG 46.84" /LENGTH=88 /DNA_ID=CAMNT_0027088103 /DNA_START=166 /DNA_END=432 /DNA_ORIENTATION=+